MDAGTKLLLKHGFNSSGNRLKGNKNSQRPVKKKKPPPTLIDPSIILNTSKGITALRHQSELSSGEESIAKFLMKNGVEFYREYYGPKLYNPRTRTMLFVDFYLPAYNLVIEYDGIHHYRPIHGEKKLEQQREKDRIKNQFCHRNGIHMLRIRGIKNIERMICEKIDKISGI